MIKSVLSFFGGVFNFLNHIGDYFSDKEIRDTQREIDRLSNRIVYLEDSIKASKKHCESIVDAINIEHSVKLSMLRAEHIEDEDLNKKGRRISG